MSAEVGKGVGGLRIAVIGSRGIPAGYSGFETFAEELCTRLVELGHSVTVYCRRGAQYTETAELGEYKGVELVYTPYLKQRELETLSHELTSILHSLTRPFDLYYFLGTRSSPWYVPLRATNRLVVVHTDGLEWKRRKWNRAGRAYLRMAEWIAVRLAADELVADAKAMQRYFQDTYGRSTHYLSYGAHVLSDLPEGALAEWTLEPGSYYLVVARIEPENNIDTMIREHIGSGSERELVVVGGMNYETPYWQHLHDIATGGRVRMLGPVYGPMMVENLFLGAYAYLHGHEVGGTNPSLLMAMGCANCALALDTVFNAEVLADAGILWDKRPGSLAGTISWADDNPEEVAAVGRRAQQRVRDHYSWDKVAEDHDRFFRLVARRRGLFV